MNTCTLSMECGGIAQDIQSNVSLRRRVEDGEHLAFACKALEAEDMAPRKWKADKLNWQEMVQSFKKRGNI